MHRAARLALVLAACVGVCVSAPGCGGGPETPRDAWAAVRKAIETRDPKRLHDIVDQDSLESRRQGIRQFRGLLARGEPPATVLAGTNFVPEDVTSGTLDDSIGAVMSKGSPFVRDGAWFLAATIVEEAADGPDAAKLVLRGTDGRTFTCWFVRDPGGWAVDFERTWNPH